jgi:hypothetical protein
MFIGNCEHASAARRNPVRFGTVVVAIWGSPQKPIQKKTGSKRNTPVAGRRLRGEALSGRSTMAAQNDSVVPAADGSSPEGTSDPVAIFTAPGVGVVLHWWLESNRRWTEQNRLKPAPDYKRTV